MSSTSTIPENAPPPDRPSPASGLLISLSPLAPESLDATLANIAAGFPNQIVEVTTTDPVPQSSSDNLRLTSYTPTAAASAGWVLTAADYLNTYKRMQETQSTACLLLGPEAQSLSPESLRGLAGALASGPADLATPRYDLSPREGLVNSAILYPVTRALFGTRPHYPLAIDVAFTLRMAERLAACAQRLTAANQNCALIWPVAEAATAAFSIAEIPCVSRAIPSPNAVDLNSALAVVAGSFFADLDAKASFWQRSRLAYSPRAAAALADDAFTPSEPPQQPDIQPMLDSFRLAYTNLHEIWSLVLPPNSLLGLKKLSLMPPAAFRMPDSLWVRIVYDFVLAYRLRTINRGHLLGALTPLYLAWVASHLLLTSGTAAESIAPAKHIEALAAAFETDKPYLVARWRWPDRFNP
jgi:glucosylglycerate synthase